MTPALTTGSINSAEAVTPQPTQTAIEPRVPSIDALRGLVMFTMIFVNDLGGSDVPPWMRHYHGRNGMTFVDLVFPAFLFIMGMSIPLAARARLAGGEPRWKILVHVLTRTLSLLWVGVLMVNAESSPSSERMGWSGTLWTVLMYLAAILAFVSISPPQRWQRRGGRKAVFGTVEAVVRVLSVTGLVLLAFAYRSRGGGRIITLRPFSIRTEWYGILGLIGWAYLMTSVVFLTVGAHRTALLGCAVLMFCLYAADRTGMFDRFWLARHVGVGEMLGSQAAVAVCGAVLGSILLTRDTASSLTRARFTVLFIAGCSAAAVLDYRLWGISKNEATPSWCLWSCAVTAALWLGIYYMADVLHLTRVIRPLRVAGQNVLLAYLLSELVGPMLELLHRDGWYHRLAEPGVAWAVARSAGCAVAILGVTALLNRLGFRLKL